MWPLLLIPGLEDGFPLALLFPSASLKFAVGAGGLVFAVKMKQSGSVESMCSSVVFTREAEAAEVTDAISELSYLAARKSRVSAELRKLGHQRCEYENEMARILRREKAAAELIEGTWEYEKKKKKLEAELANALAEDEEEETGEGERKAGFKEEDAASSDPEEKPKKMAKLAQANPYLCQATKSSHPVNLRARPTKKL